MIEVPDLIDEARSWIGVPFVHQGRSRIGCDCLGFVAAMLADLGSTTAMRLLPGNYARNPQSKVLDTLRANSREIPLEAGALLLIQFPYSKHPSHAALYTGESMIHAYQSVNKVVEHGYREPWVHRTHSIWALPLVVYA
jgi:cell wall-associated NlpC family hydrolase